MTYESDVRRQSRWQKCARGKTKPAQCSPGAFDPAKFYIPQTREAQQAIEKARQVQVACVEAFEGYAVAKVGKDKTVPLAEKQAAVAGYLEQLPTLLGAVRTLLGKPVEYAPESRDRGGLAREMSGVPSPWSDPAATIGALKPPGLQSADHGDYQTRRSLPEVTLGH